MSDIRHMLRLALLLPFCFLAMQARAGSLKAYLPDAEKANGEAVIICPGGSYHWLSKKVEGSEVAAKLRDMGYAAYVLHYRRSGTRYFLLRSLAFPQNHWPDAHEDLLDAIRTVRSEGYSKVGVMGFSAGGHLALSSGEFFGGGRPFFGHGSREGDRPDFIAAVYPVVTMCREDIVHQRSRRALMGRRLNEAALRDSLSMEKNVPGDMPPVFLTNCKDDPIVNWRNSEVMDSALTARGIPHMYMQYDKGGHGYGISSAVNPEPSSGWLEIWRDYHVKNDYLCPDTIGKDDVQ